MKAFTNPVAEALRGAADAFARAAALLGEGMPPADDVKVEALRLLTEVLDERRHCLGSVDVRSTAGKIPEELDRLGVRADAFTAASVAVLQGLAPRTTWPEPHAWVIAQELALDQAATRLAAAMGFLEGIAPAGAMTAERIRPALALALADTDEGPARLAALGAALAEAAASLSAVDAAERRRWRNTRDRFTTTQPFAFPGDDTPAQKRAFRKRVQALEHYQNTGDPGPGIELGLLPEDAKWTVTQVMKQRRREREGKPTGEAAS